MRTKLTPRTLALWAVLLSTLNLQPSTWAQGTAFTYQGRLNDGANPAQGIYDLRFTIYDSGGEGSIVAGPITKSPVAVTNGLFTVVLDFGSGVFTGHERWLEIGVQTNGAAGDFTALAPRQQLTATPYAIYAPNTGSAGTVTGPVAASQLTGTISSNTIAAGTIAGSMLAAGAVGSAQLAPGAVTTDHLADGAVTADKIFRTISGRAITFTNPSPQDHYFGWSVGGVGMNRVLIGSFQAYVGTNYSGAVYLFDLSANLLATFTNPTPADNDNFGYSVAAVGTERVLIGANQDDTGANDAGAAYLFDLTGNLLATFTNPAPAAADNFGNAVAAVGTDRVLIGAMGRDAGTNLNVGAAYLFDLSGNLLTTFTNPSPAFKAPYGENFGYSVAGAGTDRLLIGAPNQRAGTNNFGAAFLFDLAGNLLTTFTNPTPAHLDRFGNAVALVGTDRVLIGDPHDDTGAINAGAAYLFDTNGTLLHIFTNPAPAIGDLFGWSATAVGTNHMVISAYNDQAGTNEGGAAYLYDLAGNLLATFANPTPVAGDNFGWSLAAVEGGNGVLIGAYKSDEGTNYDVGAAHFFTLESYAPGLVAEGVRAGAITTASLADGAVGAAQLAISTVTITAGTGLSGGGSVALGESTTLNNTGVLSVIGNADITASTVGGTVTLDTTATNANTANTIVKRDAGGNFSAGAITATAFSGNGANLTNIPAAAIVTPPPGMVLIPAGAFTMGNSIGDGDITDATPISTTVSAFYMDVNEVSWSQWQSVYFWATNHGYGFVHAGAGKAANHPVQTVDWYDCVKWCNARSEQAGKAPVYFTDAGLTQVYMNGEVTVYANWSAKGYRLPMEAEWEKAARGGLSGQRFPWGNVINQNLANYNGATGSYSYDLGPNGYNAAFTNGVMPYTSPAGFFAANSYGLQDMAGNVFEWCWDWYGTPYAGGSDPRGPASGWYRVIRGGDWYYGAGNCRSAYRYYSNPGYGYYGPIGFRVVLAPGQ